MYLSVSVSKMVLAIASVVHVADDRVSECPTPSVRAIIACEKILTADRKERAMSVSCSTTVGKCRVDKCGDVQDAATIVEWAVGRGTNGVETAPRQIVGVASPVQKRFVIAVLLP